MRFSFSNLGEGQWGVKAAGDLGSDHAKLSGQTVEVQKRDGSIRHVTLGERLDSWNGRNSVYAIAGDDKAKTVQRKQPSTTGLSDFSDEAILAEVQKRGLLFPVVS